jgi:hypothetical protein
LAASPGNCRAVWGLTEEEPSDPVPNPPGAFPVGMVMVGTFRGSELSPNVGADAPIADVLDEDRADVLAEENGAAAKPVAPAPDCIGPMLADPKEPAVPKVRPAGVGLTDVELAGVGLAGDMVWACATPTAASHVIVTKMNIRSMALSSSGKASMGFASAKHAIGR